MDSLVYFETEPDLETPSVPSQSINNVIPVFGSCEIKKKIIISKVDKLIIDWNDACFYFWSMKEEHLHDFWDHEVINLI